MKKSTVPPLVGPRACVDTGKFYGKDKPHLTITGDRPAQADVLAALTAVLKK